MGSKRKSRIERYRNNTSKYTKANNIISAIFTVTVILNVVQLFGWDSTSISYLIFEILSTIIFIAFSVTLILDIRGRLKSDTSERKL